MFHLLKIHVLITDAVCEPEDHAAWCKCLPGFDKGPSDECVSLCAGVSCGLSATCITSVEGPTCKCLDGFMGNPFPGGQCFPEVCSPTSPCQDPMVCVGGKCKERCEGQLCGIGATCDQNTNRCVCPPFYVGNPSYKCVPRKCLKLSKTITFKDSNNYKIICF